MEVDGRYQEDYKTFYDGWKVSKRDNKICMMDGWSMEGIIKTTQLSMVDGRTDGRWKVSESLQNFP